jgi:hypothetical protein
MPRFLQAGWRCWRRKRNSNAKAKTYAKTYAKTHNSPDAKTFKQWRRIWGMLLGNLRIIIGLWHKFVLLSRPQEVHGQDHILNQRRELRQMQGRTAKANSAANASSAATSRVLGVRL